MNPTDAMLNGAAKAFHDVLRRQRPDLSFEIVVVKGHNRVASARKLSKPGSKQPYPAGRFVSTLPDEHGSERAA